MKKYTNSSRLWLMALVLVLIVGAKPQQVRAQDKKQRNKTIIIKNGDTIINGKNLKQVSQSERKKLLKELDGIRNFEFQHELMPTKAPATSQVVIRKKKDGQPEEVIIKRIKSPEGVIWKDGEMQPLQFKMDIDTLMLSLNGDSVMKQIEVRMAGLDSNMRRHFRKMDGDNEFEFFVSPPDAPRAPRATFRTERPEGKNSQTFSYANVDKDGISNRLNIRLNEANKEAISKITGIEMPKLDLNVEDLTLFPSFSNGKLNLAFSLKTKGPLSVKIVDSDLQTVLTDKAVNFNESYYKSFSLPKNGVYYLAISQNGNWFIKRVVKE